MPSLRASKLDCGIGVRIQRVWLSLGLNLSIGARKVLLLWVLLRLVLLLWVLLLWVNRLNWIALILRLVLVGLGLVVDVWLLLIVKVGSPSILLRGNLLLRPRLLARFPVLLIPVLLIPVLLIPVLLIRVLLLASVKKLTAAVDRISGVAPYFTSVDLDCGPLTISIHLEPTGHEGAHQEHSNDK
jgi:hypothetical protein